MSEESPITNPQSPGSGVGDQSPITGGGTDHGSQITDHAVEDEISLLDLAIVLAKHKKLILGLPLIAAVIAAVISLLMTPIYTGTIKILPPQQTQSNAVAILGQLGALAPALIGGGAIRNPNDVYIAMIKSQTIADEIIQRFGLQESYGLKLMVDTRKVLEKNTNIVSGRDGVITIEVEDRDPKRAADLANAYVDSLENLTLKLAVTEASQRRLFFEKQLKQANASLTDAQAELKKFQEATGLVSEGLLSLSAITSTTLRAQITAKQIQLSGMRTFATERNPEVIRTEQEIAALRTQLAKIDNDAGRKEGGILIGIEKVPETGLEYLKRVREVKYHETLFDLLARQYEAAKIDEAKNATLIQVLDKATEPERRTRPKRTQLVLLVAMVMGVISIVIAFIREAGERARANPKQAARLQRLRRYLWASRLVRR